MNLKIPTLVAAACIAATAHAQILLNPSFAGESTANWTLAGDVRGGWNGQGGLDEDHHARVWSDGTLSQTFGGYVIAAGDTITVEFEGRNEWQSTDFGVDAFLFFGGDTANILTQQNFGVTDAWGTVSSLSFTAIAGSPYIGQVAGIGFTHPAPDGEDRWINVDSVAVSVTAVPEPSTVALLLGCGALAVGLLRRRQVR